ncbi:hypothetical protein NMS86_001036 [Vibrio cholerae]|uniref:hypothetical protein n=1 Tax=Vibrio cholerae TaxID=666 RepID=UPI000E6B9F45|nr:hypothetical protein [Vibrio cholerae]EJB5293747.1 hypothetical protein [Vibrio cholerae]EJL6858602.1 hypothetical protein [Vibrio cholerae]RJK86154.1 hypothetical protein CHN45_04445 [Vibrio cholerae]
MNRLKEIWEWYDVSIVSAVVVLLLFALLWAAHLDAQEEQESWEVFSAEQNCVLIEKGRSKVVTTTGVSGNGNVVFGSAVVGGDDKYRCDDGVIYVR